MGLRITTWNANSIRLREASLRRIVAEIRPDVLCLQEIKVEDGRFPAELCRELGFEHLHVHGQKAYHGVAVLSKLPLDRVPHPPLVRHRAQPARDLHAAGRDRAAQFLHPGRRRRAGPGAEPEVQAQARHAGRAHRLFRRRGAATARGWCWSATSTSPRSRTTSGAIGSCSTWFRTRRSRPRGSWRMQAAYGFVDAVRAVVPAEREALHLVVLPRAGLGGLRPRPAARPCLAVARRWPRILVTAEVARAARGWDSPSDHVPVTVELAV